MFTEFVRLGRDSSVKQLESGTSVANLACAYDVGYGDKKTTQWMELAVFGKQAEALAPYFTKGRQFMITAKDVCTEEYDKRDGSGKGMRLKATVVDMRFSGSREDSQQQAPQQYAQHAPVQQQPTTQPPQQYQQPQQVAQPQYPQSQQPQPTAQNGETIIPF